MVDVGFLILFNDNVIWVLEFILLMLFVIFIEFVDNVTTNWINWEFIVDVDNLILVNWDKSSYIGNTIVIYPLTSIKFYIVNCML